MASECPRGNEKMGKDANPGKKDKDEAPHTWVGVRGEISAYPKENLQK